MLHKYLPDNPTLADRFGWMLQWLFEGMALDWRRRGLRHVHEAEITQRILGLWKRLRSVLERHRAGTLRPPRARRGLIDALSGTTPHPDPPGQARWQGLTPPQGGRERKAWAFPRGVAWVVRLLVPVTGQQCVGMLCVAWEEPEMREFYAAAPQLGKILRPLAHMIGATLPEWLRLPKRKDTSPRPSPQSGEGEERRRRRAAAASRRRDARSEMIVPNRRLPPKEQVEDAMRRSEAFGKPIDVKKFPALAWGEFAHAPRDGNCPPLKIGYGGRRRRPPKDYNPPRDD